MDLEHGGGGLVGVEASHALHRAAEEGSEELVEMGEEEAKHMSVFDIIDVEIQSNLLLLALLIVGGHVLHQGLSTATVEEVDTDTLIATLVGGLEVTVEVRHQLDLGAVDHAGGKNTGDLNADIGLGVCECQYIWKPIG